MKLHSLLLFALLAVFTVPEEAVGQDTTPPNAPLLYAGNVGWNGHWLLVVDSPTISGLGWNELNDDVTYEVQFAIDASFEAIVLHVEDIPGNRIEPNLAPGFYYFRIGATDSSGNVGPWSETGTLDSVVDSEPPYAAIVSSASDGETAVVELLVSDDTVLNSATFNINGEYAGIIGLRTVDYKIYPSFGIGRIVVFEAALPKGSKGLNEVDASVSDVVENVVYAPEPGRFVSAFVSLGFVTLLGRRRLARVRDRGEPRRIRSATGAYAPTR